MEFNPDLALRDISEFRKGNRRKEECIPEVIEPGIKYAYLKKGQRNYWLLGEIPLIETKGQGVLSRPRASIVILTATHILLDKEIYTKGTYMVVEVLQDDKIHFEGFVKVGFKEELQEVA